MRMTEAEAVAWFEELLKKQQSFTKGGNMGITFYEPHDDVNAWLAEGELALNQTFTATHTLTKRWAASVHQNEAATRSGNVSRASGILRAGRDAIAAGRLASLVESIRAETVGELLEQAELLLHDPKGGPVPAMVLAGGALETHLRHLCGRNNLTVKQPPSISRYKDALDAARKGGNEIISASDGQRVVAWAIDRNGAAHTPGEFKKSIASVQSVIDGIRVFVASTETS